MTSSAMQLTCERELRCTPDQLWPWITEPDRILTWMSGVTGFRRTGPPALGVGSTFEMDIREGRKDTHYAGLVTGWDPPTRYATEVLGGCIRGKELTCVSEYRLTSTAGGTRVTLICGVRSGMTGLFAKLMGFMFRVFTKRQTRRWFDTLERQIAAST